MSYSQTSYFFYITVLIELWFSLSASHIQILLEVRYHPMPMLGRIKNSWTTSFRSKGLEIEMATEKLELCRLTRSGQNAAEHIQVGDGTASFGSIKLTIICGIKKTCVKNRWIK